MTHSKPTGKTGPIRVQRDENQVTMSWDVIDFPKTKEGIERYIMQQFILAGQQGGFKILGVKQNPENHFDFTLNLPGGEVYIDLMELIYKDEDGNPYDSKNMLIESALYARQIVSLILKKSNKYQSRSETPLHLLTYITHWRFLPNETVIRLVQHKLSKEPHIFENIFYLSLDFGNEPTMRVLFPSNDPLEGQDPSAFQDNKYLNLDPGNWKLIVE